MLKDVNFESINMLEDDKILHLSDNKKAIKRTKIEKITMANEIGLSALENNPLYNAEIEIPRDSYYEFENGKLVDQIEDSREEAIKSARLSLVRLHTKNLVGDNDKSEFQLKQEGNKQVLVRTKFID